MSTPASTGVLNYTGLSSAISVTAACIFSTKNMYVRVPTDSDLHYCSNWLPANSLSHQVIIPCAAAQDSQEVPTVVGLPLSVVATATPTWWLAKFQSRPFFIFNLFARTFCAARREDLPSRLSPTTIPHHGEERRRKHRDNVRTEFPHR